MEETRPYFLAFSWFNLASVKSFVHFPHLCLHPSGGGAEEPTGSGKEAPGTESQPKDGVSQTAV